MPVLIATIIAIALKLAGVPFLAALPWWVITLPLWLGVAMFLMAATGMLIGGLVCILFVTWLERK
ncbi:hypothetical protein AB4Y32_16080 [Paraburkholderia phymatum]|uniref:Uncharacterized protein n=1 Tax=Paraburkholderia phymatum TaxID=148447 RepID=A0ACC6U0Q9_9BURK